MCSFCFLVTMLMCSVSGASNKATIYFDNCNQVCTITPGKSCVLELQFQGFETKAMEVKMDNQDQCDQNLNKTTGDNLKSIKCQKMCNGECF